LGVEIEVFVVGVLFDEFVEVGESFIYDE